MVGFLNTGLKEECFGCEACANICPTSAIKMVEDEEKFRYPLIDKTKCIGCNKCHMVCPKEKEPKFFEEEKLVFGGQNKDSYVLSESTSGGAFSAVANAWCDKDYIIFGAEANGLEVKHSFVLNKAEINKYRKSKYLQSNIGTAYADVKGFLLEGKKVLFSGTPCQIAGLKAYLNQTNQDNLLTVEVVCEGVPSPIFIDKYNEYLKEKYKSKIEKIDYRYKDIKKWDFEVMQLVLENGRVIKKDRWFNPFWSIWLNHLMSRPSCYTCPFAKEKRVADITLGDLWGVHIYCPELYFNNSGSSLIVCNSEKGKKALEMSKTYLKGHELNFSDALKYQSPMRKHISYNEKREAFMEDLKALDYSEICKKWARKPTIKLLFQKYIWGNRQKVWLWNFKKGDSINA